jgi:hypothetical protein
MNRYDLIGQLADKEHESWSNWMIWLFKVCESTKDESVIIPPYLVERWKRQAVTPFRNLTPEEQESDIKEVMKIMPIIEEYIGAFQPKEEQGD